MSRSLTAVLLLRPSTAVLCDPPLTLLLVCDIFFLCLNQRPPSVESVLNDHVTAMSVMRETMESPSVQRCMRRFLDSMRQFGLALAADELESSMVTGGNDSSSKSKAVRPTTPPIAKSGNECIVCMSNPKVVMCVPCHHVVYCEGCKEEAVRHMGSAGCPVCRRQVDSYARIFM